MKHERYIVDEAEIELLDKYHGIMSQRKDPCRYDTFDKDTLAALCRMKDKSNDLFFRRAQAAKEVIDIIAEEVGMNDIGLCLYFPDAEGSSPILRRIAEWVDRSGDKALLKKRVQELEKENALLRSLLQK